MIAELNPLTVFTVVLACVVDAASLGAALNHFQELEVTKSTVYVATAYFGNHRFCAGCAGYYLQRSE